MSKPILRSIKQLTKEISGRTVYEKDGEPAIYATEAEVKALRQLCVQLQRLFGLFARFGLDDDALSKRKR